MEFDGMVNDTFYNNWNYTTVDEDYDSPADDDPMAVYTRIVIGCCLGAIAANLAILVLIIARAYQYRTTDKWKWARLHLLGALCVVHILLTAVTVVVKFPAGLAWMQQTDGTCKFLTTFTSALQLVVLMYLTVVGIHTFFHVYHPKVLLGVRQFVICLVVHPVVWTVAFVCGYVFFGRYTRLRTYAIFDSIERFCVVDDPIMYGQWLNVLATTALLAILSYFAFISTVGMCLVKPDQSTDALIGVDKTHPNQGDGLLRWMTKSRVKAGVFLAIITVLVLATQLPMIGFVVKHSILDEPYDNAAFKRRYIVESVQGVFYLMFPMCCLILQEMGVYSLIKRIRKYT